MKGVILCSDNGNRLNPITYTIPKQLLPVSNRPVIEYIIKSFVEANIREIGIINGDNSNFFKGYFNSMRDLGCRLKYINQPKPIGYANAILCAKDFVDNKDFVFISGDSYFNFSLEKYIRNFQDNNNDVLILARELNMDNTEPISNIDEMAQIYFFNSSIFKAASRIKPSDKGIYELRDAIEYLRAKKYRVGIDIMEGEFIKVERVRDALRCNAYLLNNTKGHHIIGRDSKVENSVIGENVSIGGSCTIKDSAIYNSIIMDDCILNGVEIYDSIVGSSSTIMGKGSITGVFSARTVLYINS